MSQYNLKEIRKKHSKKVLAQKDILTLEECMVWYDVSYDWIEKQKRIYGLPWIDKGRGNTFFDKKAVDEWFRRAM